MKVRNEYGLIDLEKELDNIKKDRDVYEISNGMDTSSLEIREEIFSMISTMVDTPKIDIFARCHRGCLEGNHLVGKLCPNCNTHVQYEDELFRPNVWYTIEESTDYRFMHPYFYVALDTYFKTKKVEFLKLLTGKRTSPIGSKNIKYNIIDTHILNNYNRIQMDNNLPTSKEILNMGNHIDFFKENWLVILTDIANDGYDELHNLIEYFLERESVLRPRKLPLPPRRLITVEKSKSSKPQAMEMAKRIKKLVDIHTNGGRNKFKELDYINIELAVTWLKMGKTNNGVVSSKQGLVRHNIGSTSECFGLRAPITPLNGEHRKKWDVVHAPYSIMVAMLRYHIINILARNTGLPIYNFRSRLNTAIRNFDQDIYDIMEKRILPASSKGRGIENMLQRNPTQGQQGMQQTYMEHIKPDPRITTISTSDVSVEGENADYDGDELHITFKIFESDTLDSINVVNDVYGVTRHPGDIFGKVGIDPLMGANISSQILNEREMIKQEKLSK